jgi:methionyl-tRNA synthetase
MDNQKTISIDDFHTLDIRIGTVRSAEKVPETDKLIRLEVDFGSPEEGGLGTRQIVSGIAAFVTPESLVGQQFPFVTNLEPRMLKGLESQGMILATGGKVEGQPFALLTTTNTVSSGSRVS